MRDHIGLICIAAFGIWFLGFFMGSEFEYNHQVSPLQPVSTAGDQQGAGTSYSLLNPAPTYTVTAYCPKKCCCGKWADGITASGFPAKGRLVAAPKSIPFGTRLLIPEYGEAVVRDRGGAIKGNKLDVLFPTHQEALNWGVQELAVIFMEK